MSKQVKLLLYVAICIFMGFACAKEDTDKAEYVSLNKGVITAPFLFSVIRSEAVIENR